LFRRHLGPACSGASAPVTPNVGRHLASGRHSASKWAAHCADGSEQRLFIDLNAAI
jgi:hypothetical protein